MMYSLAPFLFLSLAAPICCGYRLFAISIHFTDYQQHNFAPHSWFVGFDDSKTKTHHKTRARACLVVALPKINNKKTGCR